MVCGPVVHADCLAKRFGHVIERVCDDLCHWPRECAGEELEAHCDECPLVELMNVSTPAGNDDETGRRDAGPYREQDGATIKNPSANPTKWIADGEEEQSSAKSFSAKRGSEHARFATTTYPANMDCARYDPEAGKCRVCPETYCATRGACGFFREVEP